MANQITPNPSVPSQVVAEVKFPKFINNLGIIPTSYKDSMSYYECLAWLCKFLEEQVIPTVNENGEAVEELQALYVELNSYVTNYFDNLDVQEEINNKLDEMATSGALQPLVDNIFNELEDEIDEQNNVINSQNARINVLESRMSEFANLPEGSTSGDAELADIRISYDGNTYDDAGDAVRGQVDILNDKIDYYLSTGLNKYNYEKVDSGYYSGTGELISNPNFYHTKLIKVKPGDVLRYSPAEVIQQEGNVFDVNGDFLANISGTSQDERRYYQYTVPSNGCFVSMNLKLNYHYSYILTINESFPDDYVFYKHSAPNLELNGSQIVNNSIDKEKCSFINQGNNQFNGKYESGYYGSTGLISSNNYSYCDLIPVKWGDIIRFSGRTNDSIYNPYPQCGAQFNSSKEFIYPIITQSAGGFTKNANIIQINENNKYIEFVVPHGCHYVSINMANAYISKFVIVKNATFPTKYVKYGVEIPNLIIEERKILTLKNTGGDFDSLRDSFDYINENPIPNGYELDIYEGIYDVCADFTDEEINSASYYPTLGFVGLYVPNNLYIKGIGSKEKIIIKGEIATSYSASKREAISTLNLKGNCTIENVTITSKYIRYPVHDDFSKSVDSIHNFINCNFINILNSAGSGRNNAYGLGLRSGETVNLKNCYIEPLMICHSNASFSHDAFLNIDNSEITEVLNLEDYNSITNVYVNINNSKIGFISYSMNGDHNQFLKLSGNNYYDVPINSPKSFVYTFGNVKKVKCNSSILIGECVKYTSRNIVAKSTDIFNGIAISNSLNNEVIILESGYICNTKLELESVSSGDLLKINSSSVLEVTQNKNEAVAFVNFTDSTSSNKFIKII